MATLVISEKLAARLERIVACQQRLVEPVPAELRSIWS